MFTNESGKFASPQVSHKTADEVVTVETQSQKVVIPDVPAIETKESDIMDEVRRLFGKFWWLWLIVIAMWLMKGE